MAASLCTDLRRVSSGTPGHKESLLTRSIRSSLDQQQSPWIAAAEQLALFPTKRCVMMRPADWQELSGVLSSLNRQCAAVKAACSSRSASSCSNQPGRDNPSFVAALELLVQLGRVTSCLLCVNGDDRSFSIARVAQVSPVCSWVGAQAQSRWMSFMQDSKCCALACLVSCMCF